jgi:hypothetical protein
MREVSMVYVEDDDQVQVMHHLTLGRHDDRPVIELIPHGLFSADVRILITPGRLRRLIECGQAYLRAHPECDRCDIHHGPVPAEAATGSESLEAMALDEVREALTRAAQDCGIDPDGMDDLMVIRAIAARATRSEPDSDGAMWADALADAAMDEVRRTWQTGGTVSKADLIRAGQIAPEEA